MTVLWSAQELHVQKASRISTSTVQHHKDKKDEQRQKDRQMIFSKKIPNERKTFTLTPENIDLFSQWIVQRMKALEIDRQNRIRIRLSTEEALLRIRDRFGDNQTVIAFIGRQFGRYVLQVEMEGAPYNFLSAEEAELGDLCSALLTSVRLLPRYNYSGRKNVLRINLPIAGWNPAARILIALFASFLTGAAGRYLLPPSIGQTFSDAAFGPLFQSWWNILNAVSGPVMFLMVIVAILNIGKVVTWGGNGANTILRYIGLDLAMASVSILLSLAWYRPDFQGVSLASVPAAMLERLPTIFPVDILTPMITFDTIQLLIIAAVIGNALNAIGTEAEMVSQGIRQLNLVGLQAASWISYLAPIIVYVLVSLKIWARDTSGLRGTVACLLLSCLLSLFFIVNSIWYTCHKMHVSPVDMLKKIRAPFWLTFSTGSLDVSYSETLNSSTKNLGIQKRFAEMSLPNGLVFYMPLSVIGTLLCIVHLAVKYQVAVSPGWYLFSTALTVLLSVAAPPVPGAGIITYSILFGQLGIPQTALVNAMVFDLIFSILASAGNQAMLQMDLVLQAQHLGLLDTDLLRRQQG